MGEPTSIAIVDAPRPQAKWGYAPATRTIAAGTWVTWSNAGQDAHTVTALDGTFHSGDLDWYALGVSAGVSVFMLLVGCFYFRRVERSFADII